jgi:UDP-2,3-diacylglucosamine pyrophosphatase LpxH
MHCSYSRKIEKNIGKGFTVQFFNGNHDRLIFNYHGQNLIIFKMSSNKAIVTITCAALNIKNYQNPFI